MTSEAALRGRDYGLLVLLWAALAAVPLLDGRLLTTHEAVHCQNVREMLAGGDWVIPSYGGRPWLERPPLPHWMTAAVVAATGQHQSEWPYRLAAALAGLACVLQTAWVASVWYGRNVGLLSGALLASMREFTQYLTGPEADIFLCLVVTTALTLFVRAAFVVQAEQTSFLGRRDWSVPAFFVTLGLTNMAKGLFFGMLFVLIPAGSFLLLRRGEVLRRFVWLWGWLAFLAAAVAWPLAAYLRQPGILDLWHSDYVGRVNQGYMREPAWYYLVHLPWNLFPWSLAALAGLAVVPRAWKNRGGPESFLLCWAVLPVLFFSVPQGKHHHYLLHNMTPWAVLAALGLGRLWAWMQGWPGWLRSPWAAAVLLGGAADLAVGLLWQKIPAAESVGIPLMIGLPVAIGLATWAAFCPRPRQAAWVGMGLAVAVTGLGRLYQTTYLNSYRPDHALMCRAAEAVGPDETLLVLNDQHPLDASWALFYLPGRARLLHNATFLADEGITARTVYVLGRVADRDTLTGYGTVEVVAESELSRGRRRDESRWALYRLRYRDDLPRHRGDVPISPMQATGRALGPHLPSPARP